MPHYLPSRWNARLGVWGPVLLADIEAELEKTATMPERRVPDASSPVSSRPRLLILTTCTYEGVLYPVWEVARLCERAGVLFYADEAWAAYMGFHPFYTRTDPVTGLAMRYNAVNERAGAHFAVQSTHKTMASFSQASMIHVSMRFKQLLEEDASPQFRWLRRRFALNGHGSFEKFTHDLHEFLRYWHSTSPHYPFLATLDVAGVQMRLEGMKLIDERLKWAAEFRARVAAECGLPEEECFADLADIAGADQDWSGAGFLKDPLKIVLMLRSPAACAAFRKALLKSHIQWEKATATTILFLVTVGTARRRRRCRGTARRPAKGRGALRRRVRDARIVRRPHSLAVPCAVSAGNPCFRSRPQDNRGDGRAREGRNRDRGRCGGARSLLQGRPRPVLCRGAEPRRGEASRVRHRAFAIVAFALSRL